MSDTAQLHKKFVEKHKWIDEQLVRTFSKLEMLALSTALSVSINI
jgi:hypothetical protein